MKIGFKTVKTLSCLGFVPGPRHHWGAYVVLPKPPIAGAGGCTPSRTVTFPLDRRKRLDHCAFSTPLGASGASSLLPLYNTFPTTHKYLKMACVSIKRL